MPPDYKLITANEQLVESFTNKLVKGAKYFRYFKTRPFNIISNHIITSLIVDDSYVPVAYGHLEKDNKILWLGIAVADDHKNKGLGKMMMQHLIEFARENSEPSISLSVDCDNYPAQRLYNKFGFTEAETLGSRVIFELKLN